MQPALTIILLVGERRDRAVRALASVLAHDAVDRLRPRSRRAADADRD
jgi:hypothetical protein